MGQTGDRGLSGSNRGSLGLSLGLRRSRNCLDRGLLLRLGYRRVNPVALQSTKAQAAELHLDTSQTADTSGENNTLSFSLLISLSSTRVGSGTSLDTRSSLGGNRAETRGPLISSGRLGSSPGSLLNAGASNGRVSFPAVLFCRLRSSLFRKKFLRLFGFSWSFGQLNDSFGLNLDFLLCRSVTERLNSFRGGLFKGFSRNF